MNLEDFEQGMSFGRLDQILWPLYQAGPHQRPPRPDMAMVLGWLEETYRVWRPTPVNSIMAEGYLAKGKDVTWGGGLYDYTSIQAAGFADVADSLYAPRCGDGPPPAGIRRVYLRPRRGEFRRPHPLKGMSKSVDIWDERAFPTRPQ